MIDTLLKNKAKAETSSILSRLNLDGNDFAVLTLHRPANVDDPLTFGRILEALEIIQNDMPIIFPVHPRTRKNLTSSSLGDRVRRMTGLHLREPLSYLDFLKLTAFGGTFLTTLPIFAIITNSYTIKLILPKVMLRHQFFGTRDCYT